jgi:hypothetical protein
MPKNINESKTIEVRQLLEEGVPVNAIGKKLKVCPKTINSIRDNIYYPNLPPLEEAIRMLERGDSYAKVKERWGEELLEEAKDWI